MGLKEPEFSNISRCAQVKGSYLTKQKMFDLATALFEPRLGGISTEGGISGSRGGRGGDNLESEINPLGNSSNINNLLRNRLQDVA